MKITVVAENSHRGQQLVAALHRVGHGAEEAMVRIPENPHYWIWDRLVPNFHSDAHIVVDGVAFYVSDRANERVVSVCGGRSFHSVLTFARHLYQLGIEHGWTCFCEATYVPFAVFFLSA